MDFDDLFPEDNPELLNDYVRNTPIEEINNREYQIGYGFYYCKIIHILVRRQKIEPIKILIKRPGVDINVVDYWSDTALHHGIRGYKYDNSLDKSFEIIKLLIDNGISLNIKNYSNDTALELSMCYKLNKINNYILCALNKQLIFVLLIPISFPNKFKGIWLSKDLIRILFEFL